MEEPKVKYCFIGKYKSSTALFEYNKLRRNQTLLEAKQMFSRCSDIHININESRINSKEGSFFIKTYPPDLIIQLFCDSTFTNTEGYRPIDWLYDLIKNDIANHNEISIENQRLIINYLGNYTGEEVEDNQQDDIVLEMPSYDIGQINQTGLGSGSMRTPMSTTMQYQGYQSNTIPMIMNDLPKIQPQSKAQSQIIIAQNQNSNSNNNNPIGLTVISEGSGSKHNSRYNQIDGNNYNNSNPPILNSVLFQRQSSLQKGMPIHQSNQAPNHLLFNNSEKITNRSQNINNNINQPQNTHPNININPYSQQQRQDIIDEIDICKWITLAILITVIIAAAISIPLIMAYSNSF